MPVLHFQRLFNVVTIVTTGIIIAVKLLVLRCFIWFIRTASIFLSRFMSIPTPNQLRSPNVLQQEARRKTANIHFLSNLYELVLVRGVVAAKDFALTHLVESDFQTSLQLVEHKIGRMFPEQRKTLFPKANADDIDLSLWSKIVGLITVEKPDDSSRLSDLIKAVRHLKNVRNELAHKTSSALLKDNSKLQKLYDEVIDKLRQLNVPEDEIKVIETQEKLSSLLTFDPELSVLVLAENVRYMPRIGWRAEEPNYADMAKRCIAARYVIISHTVNDRCNTTDACCRTVNLIQQHHTNERKFADIGFNFLIGNDGIVYEGRGFDYIGAFALGWNTESIGIAFIGTYDDVTLPTDAALNALKQFLRYLINKGILVEEYTLYALRQVRPFPYAPGDRLYQLIKTLDIGWKEYTGSIPAF